MLYDILVRLIITAMKTLCREQINFASGLFLIYIDSYSKLSFSCKPPGSKVFEPSVDCEVQRDQYDPSSSVFEI